MSKHISYPAIGSVVHYVLRSGRCRGEHRPAIVVKIWEDAPQKDHPMVQLQVFTDGTNDYPGLEDHGRHGLLWIPAVQQDEEERRPGSWHWPEREAGCVLPE